MNITFRTTPEKEDVERIRQIVVSTKFFYDHEVEVAVELIEERLNEGESTGYHFVFAEVDGVTAAYSCYGPIPMTKSSFDLYWIVTHADYRGQGIGRRLLEETYRHARALGCTLIIAETSGLEHYAPTRGFYDKNDFTLEARLRDFYDEGDDKFIYVKRLV
ncbi:MAG: GNAT family N-acetyltransferase [Candidatus Aminicenantes bacterium]|nr:GNAT family N-acetyltransferase [Candidatus Aminicenantes bacterium]